MQNTIRHGNRGTIRSMAAMQGLLLAEVGDGMVQFDIGCEGSGFANGSRILDDAVTPGGGSRFEFQKAGGNLARHGTLITENASPERTAEELQRLLGDSSAKLKAGGTLLPPPGGLLHEDIQMEQAKPRARVEVDIILENNILVQGADVRGHAVVNVRKPTKKEGPVLLSGGKIRVVGYECISGTKATHSFYQCSMPIPSNASYFDGSHQNGENPGEYLRVQEGVYQFPFCMRLSLSNEKGCPKGVMHDLPGAAVRYITIISFKVTDPKSRRQSIAHFYRTCEVWPKLDSARFLSPAPRSLRATASKSLFMGGEGRLVLTAGLVRLYWVSGQRCFVQLDIQNETKRTVTSVTLTLLRNTVIFRPQPQLDALPFGKPGYDRDPDACQTATTTKIVAESTLVSGETATRRHASAKGWWIGVPPRTSRTFFHSIIMPPSEVSIPRSRLLEVEYVLKVTLSVGTLLSTDVQVSLPVRIISFLSLDPHINCVLEPTAKKLGPFPRSASKASDLEQRSNSAEPVVEAGLLPYATNGLEPERALGNLADNHALQPTLKNSIPPGGLRHSRAASSRSESSVSDQKSDDQELFTSDNPPPNETDDLELESDYDSDFIEAMFSNDSTTTTDVTEEAWNRAVACASIDQDYGERAPRFADLYYACLPEGQEVFSRRADTRELSSSGHHTRRRPSSEGQSLSRPVASSFSHRVEEKLRATCKTNSMTPPTAPSVRHTRKPSIDDILLALSASSQGADDMVYSRSADEESEMANRTNSEYVRIGQRDICGKPGLVKSKIQELEQRFNNTGL